MKIARARQQRDLSASPGNSRVPARGLSLERRFLFFFFLMFFFYFSNLLEPLPPPLYSVSFFLIPLVSCLWIPLSCDRCVTKWRLSSSQGFHEKIVKYYVLRLGTICYRLLKRSASIKIKFKRDVSYTKDIHVVYKHISMQRTRAFRSGVISFRARNK